MFVFLFLFIQKVDPELFYPERFLTERNPAAWLPFGCGARKCIAQKLAMSQIKLFIVRLLQTHKVRSSQTDLATAEQKVSDLIQTKDVLFNGPIGPIYISLELNDFSKNQNNNNKNKNNSHNT